MTRIAHGGASGASSGARWLLVTGAGVAFVWLAGLLVTAARLHVAGLPFGRGVLTVALGHVLLRGLVLAAVAGALLAGLGVVAYAGAAPRWSFHGGDWAEIVHGGGVRNAYAALHAPDEQGQRRRADRAGRAAQAKRRGPAARDAAGDPRLDPAAPGGRLLRIVAGFNLIAVSGALGLAAGQFVAEFQSAWWAVLPAGVLVGAAIYFLLTRLGPLAFAPSVHALIGALVVLVGLLSSAPVGLLIFAEVVIATWGRRLARDVVRESRRRRWSSPVLWAAVALYCAVVVAYEATPPVTLPGLAVADASARTVGGALATGTGGVHLVQCTALADATSTDVRLTFVSAKPDQRTRIGAAAFDSGSRPSLVALALGLVGIDGPRAIVAANLRARTATCAGGLPEHLSAGAEDPALGAGVIAAAGPPGGRAARGEAPIQDTASPVIAALARRYQPTLEVTVADRFWPVSVNAVLADIGPGGTRTCLFASQTASRCGAPSRFPASADSTAYLRFPSTSDFHHPAVTEDPTSQFEAFERGEGADPGATHRWLADPGVLDPWRTAQIYFYYAGLVHLNGVAGRLPGWPAAADIVKTPVGALAATDGLIGLQYWFFYPYNYYPVLVRGALMDQAPLAGIVANVDLHQGDWEHVAVLLDARTLRPAFLYTARHADEGAFYAWSGGGLSFDAGHPIVQAAFGGHPSYPDGCGQFVRHKHGGGLLSDWRSCGSGRFAFTAATTPLVDLASAGTPWACWPGHFGEARYGFETSEVNADWFTKIIDANVTVAGPRSPLWQAENGSVNHEGVCRDGGAAAAENAASHGPLMARLAQALK